MVKLFGKTVIASTVKLPVNRRRITSSLFKSKLSKQLLDEFLKKEVGELSINGKSRLLRKSFIKITY